MFLNIPCGHCNECVKVRQMSFVQRVQMESLENHLFFCTLTYNNDWLPKYVCSNGVQISYFEKSDFTNMLKRIRVHNLFGRPFRFVSVVERGSFRSRPHLHCLFFLKKFPSDRFIDLVNLEDLLFRVVLSQWKRNVSSRSRYPEYHDLCTFVRRYSRGRVRSTYDLHYVNPVLSDGQEGDVAFYVSKYMVKQSDNVKRLQQALRLNLPDDEYFDVWSLARPSWFSSSGFGFNPDPSSVKLRSYSPSPVVIDYIRKCVSISRENFDSPKFINPVDGKSFPLSRIYLNRLDCVSLDDWLYFYDKGVADSSKRSDSLFIDERSRSAVLAKMDNDRLKFDSLNFDSDDFDDLF